MFPRRTKTTLTQDVGRSVAGDEARVVPIAHALLQDPFAEVFAEAAAGRHQAVVSAVGLRESAEHSSGHQSPVGQHGQHHPAAQLPAAHPAAELAAPLAQRHRRPC